MLACEFLCVVYWQNIKELNREKRRGRRKGKMLLSVDWFMVIYGILIQQQKSHHCQCDECGDRWLNEVKKTKWGKEKKIFFLI